MATVPLPSLPRKSKPWTSVPGTGYARGAIGALILFLLALLL